MQEPHANLESTIIWNVPLRRLVEISEAVRSWETVKAVRISNPLASFSKRHVSKRQRHNSGMPELSKS
jgi:hypothetical protein